MIYGYARVSSDGQSVDAQVRQLHKAGASPVFRETASGAKTERRELARALRALAEGDTLYVTRLDRLGRSTRDLLNTLDMVANRRSRISLARRYMSGTIPKRAGEHGVRPGRLVHPVPSP